MERDRRFEIEMLKSSEPRTVLSLIRTIEAEKRTHLAELRTGIGILTIPMSLATILIATSRYYDISQVFLWVIMLTLGAISLILIGAYLAYQAFMKLRENEQFIRKARNMAFDSFCEDEEDYDKE